MTMPQQPQVNVNISQPPLPPQQPPVRQSNLRTKRSLLKYVLLGLITLGIYDIWQMSEVGETLNLIAPDVTANAPCTTASCSSSSAG